MASEYGVQGNRVPACADATVPSGTPRCLREHEEFLGCIERRGRGHDMRMGEAPLIGGSCPAVERDAVLPTGRRANGSSSDRSLPLLGHPDSTGERSPGLSASARALQFAHPLSCLRPHQGTSGQRGACCARGQEEALREESNKPPRAPEAPSPPHPISHSHSLSDAVWFETLRHLRTSDCLPAPSKKKLQKHVASEGATPPKPRFSFPWQGPMRSLPRARKPRHAVVAARCDAKKRVAILGVARSQEHMLPGAHAPRVTALRGCHARWLSRKVRERPGGVVVGPASGGQTRKRVCVAGVAG